MEDSFEFSPLINLGGWLTVAGTVILLIARGYLVPRFTVDKWVEILEKQNEFYREALDIANSRNELLVQSVHELSGLTKTTNQVVTAVSKVAHRGDR